MTLGFLFRAWASPVGTQPNHNAVPQSAYIPSRRDIKEEMVLSWIKPRCKHWLGGWLNKARRKLRIRSPDMPLVCSNPFKAWALLWKARSVSHFANDESLLMFVFRICVEWVWNAIQFGLLASPNYQPKRSQQWLSCRDDRSGLTHKLFWCSVFDRFYR